MKLLLIKILCISILVCSGYALFGQSEPVSEIASHLTKGNYDIAINLCKEKLNQPGLPNKAKIEIRYHLSIAYQQTGQPKLAKSTIEEAYALSSSLDIKDKYQRTTVIHVANNLAYHCIVDFEFARGRQIVNKAISLLESSANRDPELLIQSYLRKITLLRMTSEIDSAILFIEKSNELLKEINPQIQDELTIQILSEKAATYGDNHELRKAIPIYLELIDIAKRSNNEEQLAVFHNNLGVAYMRMGEYGSCNTHLLKSISHHQNRANPHAPTLITTLSNLALANIYLEKYSEADSYYLQLLDLTALEYGEHHLRNAYTFRNMGLSQFYRNQYDKAIEYYHTSRMILDKNLGSPHDESADLKRLLGSAYLRMGKTKLAEQHLLEALNDWSKLKRKKHEGLTEALAELAHLYHEQGDRKTAQKYLKKAYNSVDYCPSAPFDFEDTEYLIGLAHIISIDLKSSMSVWKSHSSGVPDQNLEHRFMVCDSLGQYIKYRFDDLPTRRKITQYLKTFQELQLEYQCHILTSQKNNPDQIFNTFEKSSNVFLYEKRAEADARGWLGIPVELLDQKNRLMDSITLHLQKNDIYKEAGAIQAYSQSLKLYSARKDSLDHLLSDIKLQYPQYYHTIYHPKLTALEEVQHSLPDGTWAVSYFVGDSYVYSMIINNREASISTLAPTSIIREKAYQLNTLLQSRGNMGKIKSLCEELGDYLLHGIDLSQINKLTIIPEGVLGLIPFEILQKNNQQLISQVNVNYKYSHTIHQNIQKARSVKNALFMAPVFDQIHSNQLAAHQHTRSGQIHLPESKAEVKELASLFSAIPYLSQNATKQTFRSLVEQADIIHLATHGVTDLENPDFSHLHFYTNSDQQDGTLYAGEIVNLTLQADLVSLSACNTGVGKMQRGEGIGSLGRSFAYAGATNQVISLWPVHDESTRKIMTYFYHNLKKGLHKGDALHAAKQQYLEHAPKALQHPYYWAGLVYYGADTPLYLEKDSIWPYPALILFVIIGFILFFRFRKPKA